MADRLLLYISAASDLRAEREVLGRAVTEVPVSLAWRVVHSPGGDEPVDVDAVSRADVHLLLLGGDIRAPVGLEWRYALLAGRKPVPFLKQDALRTPAGEHFLRFVRQRAAWRPFRDPADLCAGSSWRFWPATSSTAPSTTACRRWSWPGWKNGAPRSPPRPPLPRREGAAPARVV